jgi:hypothetical protein
VVWTMKLAAAHKQRNGHGERDRRYLLVNISDE